MFLTKHTTILYLFLKISCNSGNNTGRETLGGDHGYVWIRIFFKMSLTFLLSEFILRPDESILLHLGAGLPKSL